MYNWHQNENGNYIHVIDTDQVMTVYRDKTTGDWTGRLADTFLKGKYDTPEEAQSAMERLVFEDRVELGKTKGLGWKAAKKGGYYKQNSRGIVTVKEAKSGKWFVTHNGRMLENKWLDTADEAFRLADLLIDY